MEVYTMTMRRAQLSSHRAPSGFIERRRVLRLAAALPLAMVVAGCGQKGPLYYPPKPDPPEPDEAAEEEEDEEDERTSAAPRAPRSRPV